MKKVILFLVMIISSFMVVMSQENSITFPNKYTKYDWTTVDCDNCIKFWIGIKITGPNEISGYRYDIYVASNTVDLNNKYLSMVVDSLVITYRSSNDFTDKIQQEMKEEQDVKNIPQYRGFEVSKNFKKHELFEPLRILVTETPTPIHTFYSPDPQLFVNVTWKDIKLIRIVK